MSLAEIFAKKRALKAFKSKGIIVPTQFETIRPHGYDHLNLPMYFASSYDRNHPSRMNIRVSYSPANDWQEETMKVNRSGKTDQGVHFSFTIGMQGSLPLLWVEVDRPHSEVLHSGHLFVLGTNNDMEEIVSLFPELAAYLPDKGIIDASASMAAFSDPYQSDIPFRLA